MRLFIAIQLSDEMKKSLTATLHNLKKQGIKGNYTPTQNLHMTLAFLGEVRDPRPVTAALERVPPSNDETQARHTSARKRVAIFASPASSAHGSSPKAGEPCEASFSCLASFLNIWI